MTVCPSVSVRPPVEDPMANALFTGFYLYQYFVPDLLSPKYQSLGFGGGIIVFEKWMPPPAAVAAIEIYGRAQSKYLSRQYCKSTQLYVSTFTQEIVTILWHSLCVEYSTDPNKFSLWFLKKPRIANRVVQCFSTTQVKHHQQLFRLGKSWTIGQWIYWRHWEPVIDILPAMDGLDKQ